MFGAIAGDIIGSFRENIRIKRKDFILLSPCTFFTDDTVLTVAVADAILQGQDFGASLRAYARARPFRGYGPKFYRWMFSRHPQPYNSLGNGSAMRVSPVAYACESEEAVLHMAGQTAACTHNHPEGIKGAQAIALAIFWARSGQNKAFIRNEVAQRFGYAMDRTVESIRPGYGLRLTCMESVPEAIICFLDSVDVEDAIRNAISLGGDADTLAAMAGSIAEAYYHGVPDHIRDFAWKKLPNTYKDTLVHFAERYSLPTVFPSS